MLRRNSYVERKQPAHVWRCAKQSVFFLVLRDEERRTATKAIYRQTGSGRGRDSIEREKRHTEKQRAQGTARCATPMWMFPPSKPRALSSDVHPPRPLLFVSLLFQISSDAKDAGEGEQAAAKIFRLTDEPLNIDPLSEEGARPATTNGAVEFKNIFFAYPSRPNMQVRGGGGAGVGCLVLVVVVVLVVLQLVSIIYCSLMVGVVVAAGAAMHGVHAEHFLLATC